MKIMKVLFMLLFIGSIFLQATSQGKKYHPPGSSRIEKVINHDWTFNYFPETAGPRNGQIPM
jgi:hypothetical protein